MLEGDLKGNLHGEDLVSPILAHRKRTSLRVFVLGPATIVTLTEVKVPADAPSQQIASGAPRDIPALEEIRDECA